MDSDSLVLSRPHVVSPTEGIKPAAQIAGASALAGFLFGATAGTLRSAPPLLFGTLTSLQWTLLAGTFTYTRFVYLHSTPIRTYLNESPTARNARLKYESLHPPTPRSDTEQAQSGTELVKASGFAGLLAGGLSGGFLRGPRNVLPGAVMFGLFGGVGQALVNVYTGRKTRAETRSVESTNGSTATNGGEGTQDGRQNWLQRIADSKWTPGVKTLSDEQYRNMLEERLLRVEAEIAVVDDRIAALKREAQASLHRKDAN